MKQPLTNQASTPVTNTGGTILDGPVPSESRLKEFIALAADPITESPENERIVEHMKHEIVTIRILPNKIMRFDTAVAVPILAKFVTKSVKTSLVDVQKLFPNNAMKMYAFLVINLRTVSRMHKQHCTTFINTLTMLFFFCKPFVFLSMYIKIALMNCTNAITNEPNIRDPM